jgi:hypothetical protein
MNPGVIYVVLIAVASGACAIIHQLYPMTPAPTSTQTNLGLTPKGIEDAATFVQPGANR